MNETVDSVSLLCHLHLPLISHVISYVGFFKCSTSVQRRKVAFSSLQCQSRGKNTAHVHECALVYIPFINLQVQRVLIDGTIQTASIDARLPTGTYIMI